MQANALPLVTFNTIESLVIDGQGGGDTLTVTTPSGGNFISYTPGAAPDSGTIAVTTSASIHTALVPLSFQHIGTTGNVTFDTGDHNRNDILNLYGTNNSDIFTLAASTGQARISNFSVAAVTDVINTATINQINLLGLNGDDNFNINGPQPYEFITVDGGDPSASDAVNLSGANSAVSANFGDSTSSSPLAGINGYGSQIVLNGIEVANLDANGQTLKINGTAQPDAISYTPTDTHAGTVARTGSNLVFNFSNVSAAAGAFTIDSLGGTDTVTVIGTSGADSITATGGAANATVQIGSTQTVTLPVANTDSLVIAAGNGNDALTVNSATAAFLIPITYDGGAGINALTLTGGTATADTYTPGSQLGSGTNALTFASGSELINFLNLAPIFDLVAGPLVVLGTNAANAINYSVGFNNLANFLSNTPATTWGQVSVDSYEPIEFINKTSLTINALAGDDVINLNNPNTPTSLSAITVNGGDPTASDTLIVNGTSGTDTINYTPSTTIGAGTVTVSALPTVNFTAIEQLKIDGQGGSDALTVTTPAGFDTDIYTPGATADSGNITINGAAGNTRVPLTFSHLGNLGSVTFANAGGSPDTLIVNGTANSDRFTVTGATNSILITDLSTFNAITPTIKGPGVGILELNGLTGDDLFVVSGALPWALLLDGGDPTGSDTLNLSGATGAVGVALGDITTASATTITGYGGAVVLTGIEIANINAGNNTVTTTGTTHADSITVTPTASNAATLTDAEINTVFNFSNVSTALGGFAVNGNGGSDQLIVVATQNADTIDVNDSASGANAVKVNSLLVVNYNASMPHVEVDALAGSDTINIAPSTTTTFTVDGGDPIGVLPGDAIKFIHPAAAYQLFPGPTSDSGGLNTAGFQTISWIHIESLINTGGGPAIITGTNGDDVITIIARDSSTHAGTDGVQDFTVSINNGPDILFIDTPNLLVDALAGNDQIHVREPAPNNAVWNTQIWVAGGTPAANTGNVGDQIVLETPGTQDVTYAPFVAAPALGGVTFGALLRPTLRSSTTPPTPRRSQPSPRSQSPASIPPPPAASNTSSTKAWAASTI